MQLKKDLDLNKKHLLYFKLITNCFNLKAVWTHKQLYTLIVHFHNNLNPRLPFISHTGSISTDY